MISSEVQRTLVKSPPELWTELSDPTSLGRHLGALGEIRITKVEAEKRVDWEADDATGSILIKPSGWGTKVTLSVTREVAVPDRPPAEEDAPETELADAPVDQAAGEIAEPQESQAAAIETVQAARPDEEDVAFADEPLAAEITSEQPGADARDVTEPPRGFFARLFGRRRRSATVSVSVTPAAPEDVVEEAPRPAEQAAEPPPSVSVGSAIESLQARFLPEHEPAPSSEPEVLEPPEVASEDAAEKPARDLAAELKAAEEVAVEEVTALLTSVLDRLGAAHHRPFSRA
jgi:hypothetical protein